MGFPDNEVAADNERRRMEKVSKSPVGAVVEEVISLARPTLAVVSALAVSGSSSATELTIAGGVVGGLGIVDWFRKLGSSKVNENLESLGQATEDALKRVEDTLLKQGKSIDEIKARIESQEFKDGMASASLQALRTTQQQRLTRLALILANGVKEGDLETESLDDMMRAAVELSDSDVNVLERIVQAQGTRKPSYESGPGGTIINISRPVWERLKSEGLISTTNALEIRVAIEKLQSHGFCVEIPVSTPQNWLPDVLATEFGIKFAQRIRE